MPRVRVLIVDDHEVVRLGLRAALELHDDIEVVGEAGTARAALQEAEIRRPAVILMDVRMPETDGIEACRALGERMPETKVLMLTSFADEEAVMASIMAGASGYLLKNVGATEIASAIRSVAAGESLLDPAVTNRVLSRLRNLTVEHEDREVAMLSGREKEVLGHVAKGLTNREIAEALVISENTARNHVSRILDKLGLSRRSEAASFAVRHKLSDGGNRAPGSDLGRGK